MNITLDSIRDAADKKYAPLVIDLGDGTEVELANVLRLGKEKRAELSRIQDFLADDDAAEASEDEKIEMIREILRLVATDTNSVNRMLNIVGDDIAFLMQVFDTYQSKEDLGEASASES